VGELPGKDIAKRLVCYWTKVQLADLPTNVMVDCRDNDALATRVEVAKPPFPVPDGLLPAFTVVRDGMP
jgi:hypothetical protein